MPAKVVRLRVRAAREVEVTVVALLREVPREVEEILRPRHETSALPIVWIIAPLNIVPCEMNTEPCKIKYVPKWVCLLMVVAGVALPVVGQGDQVAVAGVAPPGAAVGADLPAADRVVLADLEEVAHFSR